MPSAVFERRVATIGVEVFVKTSLKLCVIDGLMHATATDDVHLVEAVRTW